MWPSSEGILIRPECGLKAKLPAECDLFNIKEPGISLNWHLFTFHCPIFPSPVPTQPLPPGPADAFPWDACNTRRPCPTPTKQWWTSDVLGASVYLRSPRGGALWWWWEGCVCLEQVCVLKHWCPPVGLPLLPWTLPPPTGPWHTSRQASLCLKIRQIPACCTIRFIPYPQGLPHFQRACIWNEIFSQTLMQSLDVLFPAKFQDAVQCIYMSEIMFSPAKPL